MLPLRIGGLVSASSSSTQLGIISFLSVKLNDGCFGSSAPCRVGFFSHQKFNKQFVSTLYLLLLLMPAVRPASIANR